jgi:hypothetical protein
MKVAGGVKRNTAGSFSAAIEKDVAHEVASTRRGHYDRQ